jgi:hypothetical protein
LRTLRKDIEMRRRATMLVAMVALAMVVGSGVALADSIAGDGGNNRLVGTPGKDVISGAGGNDDISGKRADDRLLGDAGNDDVFGGSGDDRLQAGVGEDDLSGQRGSDFVNAIDFQANDTVDCGRGNDLAGIDVLSQVGGGDDTFSENCEAIYFPIICTCPEARSSETVADLSNITSVKEAEQAVDDGLLKKFER